jgi:hypothetical protein
VGGLGWAGKRIRETSCEVKLDRGARGPIAAGLMLWIVRDGHEGDPMVLEGSRTEEKVLSVAY